MENLSNVPVKDLVKELLGRKPKNVARPKPNKEVNVARIISACESLLNDLESGYRPFNPDIEWVNETAMNAIYGAGIWDWIDEKIALNMNKQLYGKETSNDQ